MQFDKLAGAGQGARGPGCGRPPGDLGSRRSPTQRHVRLKEHFRALLTTEPDRAFEVAELCKTLGVSDRTIRTWHAEVFAISPAKYLRLRRMQQARRALSLADPAQTSVTEVATTHGFCELGRFSVRYKALFGEHPSVTLRRWPH